MKVIKVLGTEYTVTEQSETENEKLKNANGLCEQYSKEIIINNMEKSKDDIMTVSNLQEFKNKVLRHEVIHAFFGESGLCSNSEWAENEEMVDWFAIQFPKIQNVFAELNILE